MPDLEVEASLASDIAEQFGVLSAAQLWTLVKLANHAAGRCRNLLSLRNSFARMFPDAKFEIVTFTDENTGVETSGFKITKTTHVPEHEAL